MSDNKNFDAYDINFLISSLKEYKKSVVVITSIFTLIAIFYANSIKSLYSIEAFFIPPNDATLIEINRYSVFREDCLQVYLKSDANIQNPISCFDENKIIRNFLDIALSSNFQIDVYKKNEYLSKQSPGAFVSSINIKRSENYKELGSTLFIINMEGQEPDLMEKYLEDLLKEANHETIKQIIDSNELLIQIKIDKLKEQRDEMINSEIKLVERQIASIEQEANMAKSMNIIDSNFNVNYVAMRTLENSLTMLDKMDSNSSFDAEDEINANELPRWFIYGEKALLEELKVLKGRLDNIQYNEDIYSLNQNITSLELMKKPPISEINAVRITNFPIQIDITKSKLLPVMIGLFFGFIFSVFTVLFRQNIKQSLKL